MTLMEGENECAGCGKSEVDVILYDIFMPPLIPRQHLCKPCLNIPLPNESKRKSE